MVRALLNLLSYNIKESLLMAPINQFDLAQLYISLTISHTLKCSLPHLFSRFVCINWETKVVLLQCSVILWLTLSIYPLMVCLKLRTIKSLEAKRENGDGFCGESGLSFMAAASKEARTISLGPSGLIPSRWDRKINLTVMEVELCSRSWYYLGQGGQFLWEWEVFFHWPRRFIRI